MYFRPIAVSVCLAAGALLSLPMSARAFSFNTSSGLFSTQGTTINDFDSAPNPIATYSGGTIRNSTQTQGGYAPAGDTTNFLVTGAVYDPASQRTNTGPVTIDFNTPGSYFGLYVGLINDSNLVEIFNGDTSLGQFTGAQLGNDGGSTFVNFNASPDEVFTRVVLTQLDPGAGFETDNHAFNAVNAAAVPFELSPALGSLVLVAWGVGVGLQRKLKTKPELLSKLMVK